MALEDLPEPIKQYIIRKVEEEYEPRANNHLYIKELTGCLRRAYFKRKVGKKPLDIRKAYAIFRGDLFDKVFTPLFRRNQVRVSHRIKGTPIVISGKFDFVENGVIYDLKTIASLYFIRKKGAREDDVRQIQFYAWCTATPKVRLAYMDFKDAEVIEITADDRIIEWVERQARVLYEALVNDIPPAKTEDKWRCNYCEYVEECEEVSS